MKHVRLMTKSEALDGTSEFQVIDDNTTIQMENNEAIMNMRVGDEYLMLTTVQNGVVFSKCVVLVAVDNDNIAHYQDSDTKRVLQVNESDNTEIHKQIGKRFSVYKTEPTYQTAPTTSGCAKANYRY